MPVEFRCPNGHLLRVSDKYSGRIGSCPTCAARVIVPHGGSAWDTNHSANGEAPAVSSPARSRSQDDRVGSADAAVAATTFGIGKGVSALRQYHSRNPFPFVPAAPRRSRSIKASSCEK